MQEVLAQDRLDRGPVGGSISSSHTVRRPSVKWATGSVCSSRSDRTGGSGPVRHLQPGRAQLLRDRPGRLPLLAGELRAAVNLPAKLDQLVVL